MHLVRIPFVALITALCFWSGVAVAQERVIVTLSGNISEQNRGSTGPDDVNFFRVMGVEFESAYSVTDDMLSELPQNSLSAPLPGTDRPDVSFSGPLLRDVSALAGAVQKTLVPLALDGYQQSITPDIITEYNPILATHLNGTPLALGELGPAMIVFPAQGNSVLDEELGALEVWGVFYIEVE